MQGHSIADALPAPDPINLLAVLAAAVATYAVGALIYGLLFSKLWLSLTGYTKEQLKPHAWKMAISPILPIFSSLGLAVLLKALMVETLASGLFIGFFTWLLIILPARLYNFVYSPEKIGLAVMDAIHLLLGTLVAGGIISAWP